jgi:catechol 2,3-dioxygenase-like lactoylglutathione lyase family enzyme
MTHRILLREVVIDVPRDTFAATRDFWAGALLATPTPVDGYPEFTDLVGAAAGPVLGLQEIDGGARVHIDIETDDVEAEVARLVALGAQVVARPHTWVVLRDPAGLLFCVVSPDGPDFAERSHAVD